MSRGKRACLALGGFFLAIALSFISEDLSVAVMVVYLATIVLPIYMSFIDPSPYNDDDDKTKD